ncbi:MAG: hypothetical protein EBZ13_12000 [Planctomycetia bacterium]|nr:hypothetical protein [Planctomycetia bacterium]
MPEVEQQELKQQLADHLKGQQELVLTRRDHQTRVEDGTQQQTMDKVCRQPEDSVAWPPACGF